MPVTTLLRSAGIGAVTGARTFTGIAAVALSTPPAGGPRPLAQVSSRRATRSLALLAAGELVGDKLPRTPPRTQPPALAGRAACAAVAAAALAQRDGRRPLLPAAVAAGCALGWSFAAVRGRAACSAKVGSDLPGALLEDAVAVGAALALTR